MANVIPEKCIFLNFNRLILYEHSEQARAPHTNGPRDVPRCGALSLLQKTPHYRAGRGGEELVLNPFVVEG